MRIVFIVLVLLIFVCLGVISFATILDRIAELKCAKWYPYYTAPKNPLRDIKDSEVFLVNVVSGEILLSTYNFRTKSFDRDGVIAYRPLSRGIKDTYLYKMRSKFKSWFQ